MLARRLEAYATGSRHGERLQPSLTQRDMWVMHSPSGGGNWHVGWLPLARAGAGRERAGGVHSQAIPTHPHPTPPPLGAGSDADWLPLARAGAGGERTGGVRSQAMPVLAQRAGGVRSQAMPVLAQRAGGARSQSIPTCPHPTPPPLGAGSDAGWLPLARAGAGGERAGGARSQGMPVLAPPWSAVT